MIGFVIGVLVMLAAWMIATWLRPVPVPEPPPPRPANPVERKMMGFDSPADQKVLVRVGDWNAMRLAIWRSKVAFDIATRAATAILDRCRHAEGCPGTVDEKEACSRTCPDREHRMDALVILNAARMHAPVNVRKPADDHYFAPSREYFSEIMASLAASQAELEILRGTVITVPSPPPELEEHETHPQA